MGFTYAKVAVQLVAHDQSTFREAGVRIHCRHPCCIWQKGSRPSTRKHLLHDWIRRRELSAQSIEVCQQSQAQHCEHQIQNLQSWYPDCNHRTTAEASSVSIYKLIQLSLICQSKSKYLTDSFLLSLTYRVVVIIVNMRCNSRALLKLLHFLLVQLRSAEFPNDEVVIKCTAVLIDKHDLSEVVVKEEVVEFVLEKVIVADLL